MADEPGIAVGQPFYTHAGDEREPFARVLLSASGAAVDLTGLTCKFALDDADDSNIISATSTGVTVQPSKSFTSDTARGVLYCYDHGLQNGDQLKLTNGGGSLPSEYATNTVYYVRRVDAHAFRLVKVGSSSPITVATAGTGTHSFTLLGYINYQWQSGDLSDESQAGADYKAFFKVPDGSGGYDTYPREGWWPVRVAVAP